MTRLPLHRAFKDYSVVEYLAVLWPDVSRRTLQEACAQGRVRSGGFPVAMARRVAELEDLTLAGDPAELPRIFTTEEEVGAVEILYEDSRFTVLAKPSGVAVVPARDRQGASCLGFLIRRELASRAKKAPEDFIRYRIVHRVDRLTSGLLLVARTPVVEKRLAADLEGRRVEKEYRAILEGIVPAARLTVHCPVRPGRKGRMRAEAGRGAKDAETRYEVMERFQAATLVRAYPRSGRTHQIRVHAWAAGHPLLRDPLYGSSGGAEALRLPQAEFPLALHSYRYTLPSTWEEPRSFVCPLAVPFRTALDALRAGSEEFR